MSTEQSEKTATLGPVGCSALLGAPSLMVGDRVEVLHSRCEPTGIYGTVIAVELCSAWPDWFATVRGDNDPDDAPPFYGSERDFRLVPNAKVSGAGTASAGLPGYTAGDNTE